METLSRKNAQTRSIIDRIDWWLIIFIGCFAIISYFSIKSAMTSGQYNTNFATRQMLYYVIGALFLIMMLFIKPKLLKKLTFPLYLLGTMSLILLIIIPNTPFTPIVNGAQSWYKLGPISVQPSEFMKIILILILARTISEHNKYIVERTIANDTRLLFKIALWSLIPAACILLQNDLGTTLVFIAIILGMIVVSGVSWKILLPVLISFAALSATIILTIVLKPNLIEKVLNIQPYQLGRIYSWLDPYSYSSESGYHLINSLKAIGSGQFNGVGYTNGRIYIPENHTDFIFTIISEEFGFVGSSIVLLLFLAMFIHLIRIATLATSNFNAYFIIGFISMLIYQVFQNVGMTIQLLPITGLPLPLISYGGSALWSTMVGFGIVMSIYFHDNLNYSKKRYSKRKTKQFIEKTLQKKEKQNKKSDTKNKGQAIVQ